MAHPIVLLVLGGLTGYFLTFAAQLIIIIGCLIWYYAHNAHGTIKLIRFNLLLFYAVAVVIGDIVYGAVTTLSYFDLSPITQYLKIVKDFTFR